MKQTIRALLIENKPGSRYIGFNRRITIPFIVIASKFPSGFTIDAVNTDVKKSGCFALYC